MSTFFQSSILIMPGLVCPCGIHLKKNPKNKDASEEMHFLEEICREVRKDSPEKSSFLIYHLLEMHRGGKMDENTRIRIWNYLMFHPAPDHATLCKLRGLIYKDIVEEYGYPFNQTQ